MTNADYRISAREHHACRWCSQPVPSDEVPNVKYGHSECESAEWRRLIKQMRAKINGGVWE